MPGSWTIFPAEPEATTPPVKTENYQFATHRDQHTCFEQLLEDFRHARRNPPPTKGIIFLLVGLCTALLIFLPDMTFVKCLSITLLAVGLSGILPAGAQDMPYHPYRKVVTRYYSLQPVYAWLKHHPDGQARPMPDWIGSYDANGLGHVFYHVQSVVPGGLIVQGRTVFASSANSIEGAAFFLTNYPSLREVVDGQEITFLAIRAGSFIYTDAGGGTRTIPLFDYGVPYNPFTLAAERAGTNFSATNSPNKTAPAPRQESP